MATVVAGHETSYTNARRRRVQREQARVHGCFGATNTFGSCWAMLFWNVQTPSGNSSCPPFEETAPPRLVVLVVPLTVLATAWATLSVKTQWPTAAPTTNRTPSALAI